MDGLMCPRCGAKNPPGKTQCESCGETIIAGDLQRQLESGGQFDWDVPESPRLEKQGYAQEAKSKGRNVTLAIVWFIAMIAIIVYIWSCTEACTRDM